MKIQILKSVEELHEACCVLRQQLKQIGLIPTMGALHAGHVSLVRAARNVSDVVVVSIFVNPIQFGPNEDYSLYPRTLEHDLALLESEQVDIVFTPAADEMFPAQASTFVTVEGLSERLDGASRPGHFRGVTTVVNKLFNIVQPHRAFFGQKDAAQVAILRKMIADLNLPVELIACPIVRERDGLALSSRNVYLNAENRKQALVLNRSLKRMEEVAAAGQRSTTELLREAQAMFASEPGVRLDYLVAVDPVTLEAVPDLSNGALVAVAAFIGPTRLIDNLLLPAAN